MNRRRDAFLAAARMSPEIYAIAARGGGVCTIGSCTTKPGIVTSVVEECRITLDQRHLDPTALATMLREAREAAGVSPRRARSPWPGERLWNIEPILFNRELVAMCGESIRETCGTVHQLPLGSPARCGGGREGGRPDRDDVRPEPAPASATTRSRTPLRSTSNSACRPSTALRTGRWRGSPRAAQPPTPKNFSVRRSVETSASISFSSL